MYALHPSLEHPTLFPQMELRAFVIDDSGAPDLVQMPQ